MCKLFSALLLSLGCFSTVHAEEPTPRLYVIGDSTAASYAVKHYPLTGWAQVLQDYLDESKITVVNKAISGRSSKSFRDEGNWTPIHEKLTAGDFVFIQFGHNDQKQKDPKRYTEPFGTYTENLSHYIKDIKAKGATPVLLTSINRNSWTDETTLAFSLGDYPDAVRALAKKEQIRLVDLEKVMVVLKVASN